MPPERTGLSKTLLLKGMQCPKALWLSKNPPPIELPTPADLAARYAVGTEVGLLAQQLFPGGTEVPYAGLTVAQQVERTRELIDAGAGVIYEASFAFDGIFVKVDILVRQEDGWEIHEVKMGTAVKEVNCADVAIQLYVLEGCGLRVVRTFLVHIDNSYVRQGAIETQQLFAAEDVTAAARGRQPQLVGAIAALRAVLREGSEPAIDIGPWCHDPYDCDFIPWCWRHVPAESVFSLSGRMEEKFVLYRDGFIHLVDVPLDRLKPKQRFEAEATLGRQEFADPAAVRDFLAGLWYPLCHLDFETFSTPIPPFDGTHPYQQLPFQFSLHRQDQAGADAEHAAFLAQPHTDPRRELAERLLAAIPPEACVLTYNQSFEKGVLRDLAAAFPDLAPALQLRIDHVRDLLIPFRSRAVYRWPMQGSASIKQVLPAMVPDLSYDGLAIADGGMAMLAYHEMCATDDPQRLAEIRRGLLEYCRLDTWAMVRILGELERIQRGEKRI